MSHPDSPLTLDVPAGAVETYKSQGWRPATAKAPAANASTEKWRAFAIAQGLAPEDVEGMKRAELRAALS